MYQISYMKQDKEYPKEAIDVTECNAEIDDGIAGHLDHV
jgi:hypothetical protein